VRVRILLSLPTRKPVTAMVTGFFFVSAGLFSL